MAKHILYNLSERGLPDVSKQDRIHMSLKQVEAQLLATEGDLQAVMVRGSFITGLMTPTSDVDMYIITNKTGPEAFHLYQDGFDFHIRRFPESYLSYEIAERNLRYIGFFRHARALYDPKGVFRKLKDSVDQILTTDLAATWLTEVKHQASDVKGQLEKGDFQTGLYLIRFGAHLLAQTALLLTPNATYKHKDVIASLRESQGLEGIKDDLFQLMDVQSVNRDTVISKYTLLMSTIDLFEDILSGETK